MSRSYGPSVALRHGTKGPRARLDAGIGPSLPQPFSSRILDVVPVLQRVSASRITTTRLREELHA